MVKEQKRTLPLIAVICVIVVLLIGAFTTSPDTVRLTLVTYFICTAVY